MIFVRDVDPVVSPEMSGTSPKALITGIGGQDGYYLAARLCQLGYSVVGTSHRPDAAATLPVGDHSVPVLPLDLGSTPAVDEIVRSHRWRPLVRTLSLASTYELQNSPQKYATSEASTIRGVPPKTVS